MKDVVSYIQPKEIRFKDGSEGSVYEPSTYIRTTLDVIEGCVEHYRAALKKGIKPQVARGIIPQCAYTVAWCAFQPTQMENFFKMRCDSHAQWEIQQFAYKMKESVEAGFMEIKLSPEREAELFARMEDYAKNGAAVLMSKEEMIKALKGDDITDEDIENHKKESSNILTLDDIEALLDIDDKAEQAGELDVKDEDDICENCGQGEPCNKYEEKIHCNKWDKSYLKNHTCDEFKTK